MDCREDFHCQAILLWDFVGFQDMGEVARYIPLKMKKQVINTFFSINYTLYRDFNWGSDSV